jgi:predicted ester cyclase
MTSPSSHSAASSPSQSNETLTIASASALAKKFYCVLDIRHTNPDVLAEVVAPGWRNNTSNGGFAEYADFLGAVGGLRAAVPDLEWTIDEILVAGDQFVVRGHGRGTPAASLFGMPATGRAFSVLSIDIHTVSNGLISSTWHLEDWAGAMQQLAGATPG